MASTSIASRKRRRVSEESVSDWDDDTIAVLPVRQNAAADIADREPLQESTSRGNERAPTRVASHAEAALSSECSPKMPVNTHRLTPHSPSRFKRASARASSPSSAGGSVR